MSTVQLCIIGSGSLTSNTFTSTLTHTSTTIGTYSAGLTFNTDGTTTGNYASNSGNWYSPTSAGIGTSFWARLTTSSLTMINTSGSLAGGGWVQLSSAQGVTFTNSGTSNEGTGNYTVQFATDAAGANITGTISGSIDVGRIM